ncbi:MAG: hypothetical protein AAF664_22995, partial [Planctomycetota bacterium]
LIPKQTPVAAALAIIKNSTFRAAEDVNERLTPTELLTLAKCMTNKIFEPEEPVELQFPKSRELLHRLDNESFCRMFAADFYGETLFNVQRGTADFNCLLFSFTLLNTTGLEHDFFIGSQATFDFLRHASILGINELKLIDAMIPFCETIS